MRSADTPTVATRGTRRVAPYVIAFSAIPSVLASPAPVDFLVAGPAQSREGTAASKIGIALDGQLAAILEELREVEAESVIDASGVDAEFALQPKDRIVRSAAVTVRDAKLAVHLDPSDFAVNQ